MGSLLDFYAAHPFWSWIAAGAAMLAIEIAVGSGYLLWAAAAAGVVALLTLSGLSPGLAAELGIFAVLTIVSSLVSNRFFPPKSAEGPDINDTTPRLIGRLGHAVGPFRDSHGRVFVDGKEWNAYAEGDIPADGDRIEVLAVQDGATLAVRKT